MWRLFVVLFGCFYDSPSSSLNARAFILGTPSSQLNPLSFRTGADAEVVEIHLPRASLASLDEESSYEDAWRRRRINEMLEDQRELRTDAITELFAPDHFQKLKELNKPDEAFGAVFQLDGVVLDMEPLKRVLWCSVAGEFGVAPPTETQLADSLGLSPSEAVVKCFKWGTRGAEADKYTAAHKEKQTKIMASIRDANTQSRRNGGGSSSSSSRGVSGPRFGGDKAQGGRASFSELPGSDPPPARPSAEAPTSSPSPEPKSTGNRWSKPAENPADSPPPSPPTPAAEAPPKSAGNR
eukprot:CAMPEP_0171724072 /NCGR_PEP_ID=MMETSP0991-20121206/24096_1 /TAXON_ID=483369 /ORGANISM="non described non described, Strain CCMP2098" /LENGTH=295 /DNA_ID=CAMNT_0012316781 /DNA_START=100 /DNA_END=983 /DNA_ORIENTATION=-